MRKLTMGCLIVAMAWLGGGKIWGQDAGDRPREVWKAEWITAAGVPERDEVVLHFRKLIELNGVPARFLVDVSADNQFVFYVNGKRVGTGPAKSDLAHWRYESFDLGPYLMAGKNVLAATVWNFGTHAAVAQMSDRVGFLVHGNGEAERAADTDENWEVEREMGITTVRPEVRGYYAGGPGERLDAGKYDWSFDREEVADKSAWTKSVSLGRGALRGERDGPNNWQLVKDPLPAMEMREVDSGKVVRVSGVVIPTGSLTGGVGVTPHSKASVLVDRGELVTGYPRLAMTGGAGSKIRMTYAEALVDAEGKKGNRNEIAGKHIVGVVDEFLLSGVPQTVAILPLEWRTWRYLQIDVETGDSGLRIDEMKTWFSAYPFEERGYFRSDDPMLKTIWEIGWRTARLDAHDTYMDTPYWERLQYIGDTRIQALISYAVAGDDRLARQAIDAFNNSRIPDGLTQSRYPSGLVQMIPTFSLLWVGMVHDIWQYRGDSEFVKVQLPGTRTVLDWYLRRQRKDGLLGRIAWWPFVDWGKDFEDGEAPQEADGESSVMTLQFLEALRYMAELEEAYGDKQVAEIYREAASRAAAGVWKLCWSEEYGLLADTPAQRHFSQHANVLGVWLDVVPAEKQKSVMNSILAASDGGNQGPEYHIEHDQNQALPQMTLATYYFRYYLARAVEHAGMGDSYLYLLRPWREMIALGLTTWAESPEPTRSDSHAWSAHPNFDLLTIVAGIRPVQAGFGTVRIDPHLGYLKNVEAGLPTVHGMIEVKYTRVGDGLEAEVTLPEGVTGELVWEGKETELHSGKHEVKMMKQRK